MARAIWSGVLSFGLVSVPVRLYSATEAHQPAFHQFEKGTADRVRYACALREGIMGAHVQLSEIPAIDPMVTSVPEPAAIASSARSFTWSVAKPTVKAERSRATSAQLNVRLG